MKKTIFMITAAASLLIASCGKKADNADAAIVEDTTAAPEEVAAQEPAAEASIVGTWKLSDVDLGMEAPKGKEQAIEDMKKKMIAETTYTFNDDGTMTFTSPMVKEAMKATYTYADGKVAIIDNTSKKEDTMTVEELTADKLVLSSEQRGNKAVMTFSK